MKVGTYNVATRNIQHGCKGGLNFAPGLSTFTGAQTLESNMKLLVPSCIDLNLPEHLIQQLVKESQTDPLLLSLPNE